jgi:hypothetical protein
MTPEAYLIKQAITVGRLADVAKRFRVPLEGDWRYAAKLLAKGERATPLGQRHYRRVLGFTTPTERRVLSARPDVEMGVFKLPGGPRRVAVGKSESLKSPFHNKDLQQTIHTHPGRANLEGHKTGPFGSVFPSSMLDLGYFPIKTKGGVVLDDVPKGLTQATSVLKDQMRQRLIMLSDDLSVLRTPVSSTHTIYAPSYGTESVMKGSKGLLRRLYFRQADERPLFHGTRTT